MTIILFKPVLTLLRHVPHVVYSLLIVRSVNRWGIKESSNGDPLNDQRTYLVDADQHPVDQSHGHHLLQVLHGRVLVDLLHNEVGDELGDVSSKKGGETVCQSGCIRGLWNNLGLEATLQTIWSSKFGVLHN